MQSCPGETRTCRRFFVYTHTLYAFPFFTRASFQWANAFGNESKQEPGTDSWVLTPHPVRAEQCCCHRKQRALMSEVKLGAHTAKVKMKELYYLSTGVLKQGAPRSKPPFTTKNIPFQCLTNETTPLPYTCNCVEQWVSNTEGSECSFQLCYWFTGVFKFSSFHFSYL